MSDDQLCSTPANYGGCSGQFKDYFDKYCKKSCGICGDGVAADNTVASCEDACPGTNCAMYPPTFCENPEMYGSPSGCNGQYKDYFHQFCKKTCNVC